MRCIYRESDTKNIQKETMCYNKIPNVKNVIETCAGGADMLLFDAVISFCICNSLISQEIDIQLFVRTSNVRPTN